MMDVLAALDRLLQKALTGFPFPSPVVRGASDGDGFTWRWVVYQGRKEPYRGEIVLILRPDTFRERVLTQLSAGVWLLEKPEAAWSQTYPLPHLSIADALGHTVDTVHFQDQLRQQLRSAKTDIERNAPRLETLAQSRVSALDALRKLGLRIR